MQVFEYLEWETCFTRFFQCHCSHHLTSICICICETCFTASFNCRCFTFYKYKQVFLYPEGKTCFTTYFNCHCFIFYKYMHIFVPHEGATCLQDSSSVAASQHLCASICTCLYVMRVKRVLQYFSAVSVSQHFTTICSYFYVMRVKHVLQDSSSVTASQHLCTSICIFCICEYLCADVHLSNYVCLYDKQCCYLLLSAHFILRKFLNILNSLCFLLSLTITVSNDFVKSQPLHKVFHSSDLLSSCLPFTLMAPSFVQLHEDVKICYSLSKLFRYNCHR